jgi:hypothetical protein
MDKSGQALVETALLLPLCIFITLVYFVQLAFFHDALVLQTASAQWARQNALELRPPSSAAQSLLTTRALIGTLQPPRFSRDTVLMSPRRIFVGAEVVPIGGSVITAHVQSRLLPRRIFRWFMPSVPFHFSAEFPADPPIPEAK